MAFYRPSLLWKNCFVSEKIIPFDSEKIKNFRKKKSEVLTTNKNGLSEATTASEVKSDLIFGIYGSNFICYHICFDRLGLFRPFF